MDADSGVTCCGSVAAGVVNSCPFSPVTIVVGEGYPLDDGRIGTIMLGTCALHEGQVVAYVMGWTLGDITLVQVEERQAVYDSLVMAGHDVWEMVAA